MAKLTLKLTKKFEKSIKQVKYLSELRLFFGVVDTRKKLDGMLAIDYMNINELGSKSKNIPARPFFRKVLFQQRKNYITLTKQQFSLVANGEKTAVNAMKTIGEYLKQLVVASIINGSYAPNSPITLEKKGPGSRPLIDTTTGINSVGYRIYRGNTIIFSNTGGNL